jgi:hypothetical protein
MKKFVWPKSVLAMIVIATPIVGYGYWRVAYGPWYLTFQSAIEWVDNSPVLAGGSRLWKLRVPKEFSVRKDDYNRTAYNPLPDPLKLRKGEGFSFVWMSSAFEEPKGVVPYKVQKAKTLKSFGIEISNGGLSAKHAHEEYCLTLDELEERQGDTRCDARHPVCPVKMSYHGWPVTISVESNELYRTPKRVCSIAHDTLELWTTSIDDLRRVSSKN